MKQQLVEVMYVVVLSTAGVCYGVLVSVYVTPMHGILLYILVQVKNFWDLYNNITTTTPTV